MCLVCVSGSRARKSRAAGHTRPTGKGFRSETFDWELRRSRRMHGNPLARRGLRCRQRGRECRAAHILTVLEKQEYSVPATRNR